MDTKNPLTASDVCDALGRKAMAENLGVGVTAISNASVQGMFSARWYVVIKRMCDEAGVECPSGLFSFIPSAMSKHSGSPSTAPEKEAS